MNQCINIKINQQLSRMSNNIADELQAQTACNVVSSCFASNIMVFYVFMDLDGLPSIVDYRIVISNLVEHITDLDVYVNYLMACLYSKIFVQGNINSMSKVVYNTSITNGVEGSNINSSTADDTSYQGCKDLFYINEDISIKFSLEDGILIIQDKGYGNTLIDLNRSLYSVREVA